MRKEPPPPRPKWARKQVRTRCSECGSIIRIDGHALSCPRMYAALTTQEAIRENRLVLMLWADLQRERAIPQVDETVRLVSDGLTARAHQLGLEPARW